MSVGASEIDSLSILKQKVIDAPKDGAAWTELGYALLEGGLLKEAENAFKKGERYGKLAAASNGRGLVLVEKGRGHRQKAFSHFRKALRIDPMYIEAQMNIARTHARLNNPDAEREYRKVMKMDSTYAPVYLELAQWYLDQNYEVYHDELRVLYESYIALRPDDLEGHYGVALVYTDQKNYGAVLDIVRAVVRNQGGKSRWLALMAQAYAARGEPDQAVALFEKYFDRVEALERSLYEDLRLVARPEELAAYQNLAEAERRDFLDVFWRKRDPLLISGGKARRAEHYRRVWYARNHFADKVVPWDRRGEVYIRYGEPDYRSRSGFPNRPPPAAVDLVKQRNAHAIYEQGEKPDIEMNATGWKYLTVRNGRQYWRKPLHVKNELFIEPVFAIDRNADGSARVPWESWVYAKVGGGVEFVFTDQVMNGRWDFPPMPPGILNGALIAKMGEHDPGYVLANVSSETPDHFDIPPGVEPLPFYYDVVRFRGANDKTDVEVYFGLPPEEMQIVEGVGDVLRTLVLSDSDGEEVYRDQQELRFGGIDTSKLNKGAFVPELASLDVPVGDYKLAVQVTDRQSGKWGVYVQELQVPGFADTLAMSDLEMAWQIGEKPMGDKFRKGDAWVMPMPSRNYLDQQSVFVYYEIYNLMRDEFGQTKYRIDYQIQQDVRSSSGVFGALSFGVRKLIATGKPQVTVGYEREGRDLWEPVYLELDVRKVKLGLNQVQVQVRDLVSGQTVSRRAMFRLLPSQ